MPTSAREPQRLDTSVVVDAALELTRRDGISALSMRTVADRLGVTPMALYHYVRTKDELVKLVADAVVGQVPLPQPGGDWRASLRTAMEDYRKRVARYPGVSAVLLSGGLLPHARALIAAMLAQMLDAGFTAEEARQAYAAFHLLVLGRLTVDEAARSRPKRGPAHERDPEIDAYLRELQSEASYEHAVEILLDGLAATLAGRSRRKRAG